MKDYVARHGQTPTFFSAFAYDAARMVVDRVKGGGVLREGLAGLRDYAGVMGSLSMRPNREVDYPTHVVQNRGGKIVRLGDGDD